jgi:hypothetical protein
MNALLSRSSLASVRGLTRTNLPRRAPVMVRLPTSSCGFITLTTQRHSLALSLSLSHTHSLSLSPHLLTRGRLVTSHDPDTLRGVQQAIHARAIKKDEGIITKQPKGLVRRWSPLATLHSPFE